MLDNLRTHKKMYITLFIALALTVAAGIIFNLMVKPYAVYADGTKVYVNYGFSEAQADGITVPARDYLVVR